MRTAQFRLAVLGGSGHVTYEFLVICPPAAGLRGRSQGAQRLAPFRTWLSETVGTLRELLRRPMSGIRI